MPLPIIAMGAIAVATAAAQMYSAEQARGASAKRLREVKALFDGVVPPDLGIEVWDDPRILNDVPPTKFDMTAITPEQVKMVGEFKPEVAQFIQQQAPEMIKATGAGEAGRKAQMEALRKYAETVQSGYSPELEAGLMEAQRAAGKEAQSRQASILQDASRRGTLTSGIQMASQMGAGADAAERMAQDAQRAALAQYAARQNAIGQSASLGGQIRASDISEQARNADILNQFNQQSSARYQDYLQGAANTSNIENRYNAARANQDVLNRIRQSQTSELAANRGTRMDIEQQRRATAQAMYDNEMAKRAGQAGVGYERANIEMQSGQDRARAIQGIGDTAQAGAQIYSGQKKPVEDDKKSIF
jgi:hypothetical protein